MSLLAHTNNVGVDVMPITTYKVTIRPSELGGYWATCDMPNGGVNTAGDTLSEVQANMFEAMDLWLEDCPDATEYTLDFEVKNA